MIGGISIGTGLLFCLLLGYYGDQLANATGISLFRKTYFVVFLSFVFTGIIEAGLKSIFNERRDEGEGD